MAGLHDGRRISGHFAVGCPTGWAAAQTGQWEAPFYWRSTPQGWSGFGLHGLRRSIRTPRYRHISYYEADAYARWRGLRLPTEPEWEAAVTAQPHGEPELRQLYDRVWQWTSSAYAGLPGFAPVAGAVGEYNGKFMVQSDGAAWRLRLHQPRPLAGDLPQLLPP